jgi:ATPase family associated with various cellular activities (AAA)
LLRVCLVLTGLSVSYGLGQVIMATNRQDTLDPALLRPGRLDRKIEFPMPDRRQKRLVFQVGACCAAGGHAQLTGRGQRSAAQRSPSLRHAEQEIRTLFEDTMNSDRLSGARKRAGPR